MPKSTKLGEPGGQLDPIVISKKAEVSVTLSETNGVYTIGAVVKDAGKLATYKMDLSKFANASVAK